MLSSLAVLKVVIQHSPVVSIVLPFALTVDYDSSNQECLIFPKPGLLDLGLISTQSAHFSGTQKREHILHNGANTTNNHLMMTGVASPSSTTDCVPLFQNIL